jgi:hypothetical protein
VTLVRMTIGIQIRLATVSAKGMPMYTKRPTLLIMIVVLSRWPRER